MLQVMQGAKMTPQEFCYWLQGLLELSPDLKNLNEAQVKMIRDHLGYVFTHLNPTLQQTITTYQEPNKSISQQAQPNTVWVC